MDGGGAAARWGSTLGDGLRVPTRKFSDLGGLAWVADRIGSEPPDQRLAWKPRAAAGRRARSDQPPPGPAAQPGPRFVGMSSAGNGRQPDAINKLVLDGLQRPSLVFTRCVRFGSFDCWDRIEPNSGHALRPGAGHSPRLGCGYPGEWLNRRNSGAL